MTGRVAVLELSASSTIEGLDILSDQVRGAVAKSASTDLKVMTRENMEVMLSDMGIDATCVSEGACEVETARNLGVDYVVTGKIAALSGKLVLSLKLHETKTGVLLSQENVIGDDVLTMLDPVAPAVEKLLAP